MESRVSIVDITCIRADFDYTESMVKDVTSQLTIKQQKFIDCYDGNIKAAARQAGLSYDYCRRLVTKGHIMTAIRTRQDTEVRPTNIATRQDRQLFWSQQMRDTGINMRDRLRASELLGKSEGDFTDKIEHDGRPSLLDVLQELGRERLARQGTQAGDKHSG